MGFSFVGGRAGMLRQGGMKGGLGNGAEEKGWEEGGGGSRRWHSGELNAKSNIRDKRKMTLTLFAL